jgi:hypothetical protein
MYVWIFLKAIRGRRVESTDLSFCATSCTFLHAIKLLSEPRGERLRMRARNNAFLAAAAAAAAAARYLPYLASPPAPYSTTLALFTNEGTKETPNLTKPNPNPNPNPNSPLPPLPPLPSPQLVGFVGTRRSKAVAMTSYDYSLACA